MPKEHASNGQGSREALPLSLYAKVVYNRLADIAARKGGLELVQITNDHESTDAVPGEPPKIVDGKVLYDGDEIVYATYGERYAEFDAQAARVEARANERPGTMALVDVLIAAANAQDQADIASAKADAQEVKT